MIRVKEMGPGGLWLVDLTGLCRVTAGRRIVDLLEPHEADALANVYETANPGLHADIKSYSEIAEMASSCSDT
jgi:hypothetical protein